MGTVLYEIRSGQQKDNWALAGLPAPLETFNLDEQRIDFKVFLETEPKDANKPHTPGNVRYVIYTKFRDDKEKQRAIAFEHQYSDLIPRCMHTLSVTSTAGLVPTGRSHVDKSGLAKIVE